MADALISPTVAAVGGAISVALIIAASAKVKKNGREGLTSTMGVLGAFVFAAQMINFSIPGTGSSGHIIGGVLLAAILGPWAGFITICSVLIVQCLVFADGGLMALGCNILNMGAMSCLVAYPLIYRPIARGAASPARIITASIAACVVGLELGALLVTVETQASGITELPFGAFLSTMLLIHLAIGACEGVATGLVLTFVRRNSPSMLTEAPVQQLSDAARRRRRTTLWVLGAVAVIFAVAFTWIASTNPDGLEWSVGRIAHSEALGESITPVTAFIPDYDSYFAGIIGAIIVMALLWAFSAIFFHRKREHCTVRNS